MRDTALAAILAAAAMTVAGPAAAEDNDALTGRYSQIEIDCGSNPTPPRVPVRELVFSSGNRFSVTWAPFESYVDYVGDYMHDPANGRLSLTITDGNRHPGGTALLSGTAEIRSDGRRLILDGFNLGDGLDFPSGPCRYVFGRI
jgi:hypothetical protein